MNEPSNVRLKIFRVHLQHGIQLLIGSQQDAQYLWQSLVYSQHGAQPVGTNPVKKKKKSLTSFSLNFNFKNCSEKHFENFQQFFSQL